MLAPYVWWRRRGVRCSIYEDRVVKHTGRMGSATEEIRFDDVSRVRTSQSIGERILGCRPIVVDTGVDGLTLAAVSNHTDVVETIHQPQTAG